MTWARGVLRSLLRTSGPSPFLFVNLFHARHVREKIRIVCSWLLIDVPTLFELQMPFMGSMSRGNKTKLHPLKVSKYQEVAINIYPIIDGQTQPPKLQTRSSQVRMPKTKPKNQYLVAKFHGRRVLGRLKAGWRGRARMPTGPFAFSPQKASTKFVMNVFLKTQAKEILCKPMEEYNERSTWV